MPKGQRSCHSCKRLIGARAKRCRHCVAGIPVYDAAGYVRRYVPGHPLANSIGYAQEHRWLFYEMAIPIPDGHHVHHVNGRKDDNRWSNLETLSKSDHHRRHIQTAGVVTNQYGTFSVLTDGEERRDRARRRNKAKLAYKNEWRRRRRKGASA